MDINGARGIVENVHANVRKVIKGKGGTIGHALAVWMAGGHLLLEDVPGTGKTMLARAISKSIDTSLSRIQFTPDLLPADITGSSIFSKKDESFHFIPGPVFSTVVLADEINRATPRTQSALLQAMGEGEVTVENQTHELSNLFFVIATQNPVEQHGTFPLPEAQLDRFMMRISLGYPSGPVEEEIIKAQILSHPIDAIHPVTTLEEWAQVKEFVKTIRVEDRVVSYAVKIVEATRRHQDLVLGASPRASLSFIRCAQALALMMGSDFVRPEQIKQMILPILEHRIALTPKAKLSKVSARQVLEQIAMSISVPMK